MRILLQKVTEGRVRVQGETIGEIGPGYVLLVGVGDGDGEAEADRLAKKVANLRLFPDQAGKFDRSLLDVAGGALVVSQFTLYADARKGRRPSFIQAARPEVAEPLVNHFAARLRTLGVERVETGRFQAMMDVEIHNDGPVTIWLDSAEI
ncbi:MAG: D-aminoacyl-tRNA deacylase [Phycisphaeraceae bacterium]